MVLKKNALHLGILFKSETGGKNIWL